MAKERLRILKKDIVERKEVKIFARFVIVGQDVFALEAFYRINQLFPGQVKILAERSFEIQDTQWFGPSTIRGESNIAWMERHFPAIANLAPRRKSLFFKDQKFHRFGGRTKSEELIQQEPFYIEAGLELTSNDIFPHLQTREFLDLANANLMTGKLLRLNTTVPDDLIEKARVEMHLADASTVRTEFLFWGNNAQQFVNFYQPKENLSNEFLEWSESTGKTLELKIQFKFQQAITEQHHETLFIPQSYTHPWGHYIGEFRNLTEGGQIANFLAFIDSEHSDEENVGRCLRSLKRSLEKIFPNFSAFLTSEFISLKEKSPCLKIDDRIAIHIRESMPYLYFIGQEAPIAPREQAEDSCEDSLMQITCATRALAAQAEISRWMTTII